MRPAHAALLLALSALASGCFGNGPGKSPADPTDDRTVELSPKQYGILAPEEMWVTASDGMRINNAVYRPDTTEPSPVFINFSPYWSDSAMREGDAFAKYMIAEYVPRGYTIVLSAVRGTGHSEGCFEVASDRESRDLHEVVEHFATQPWSNGNIAAGGKSYDSTSQNGMVAKFPHPALKGLFHVSGITDMYRYTFAWGTPARADSAAFTTYYGAGQGLSEYAGGAGSSGQADEDPESLARILGDAACVQMPEGAANAGASTAAGAKTPYWVERDWTRAVAAADWNGSIFFVHGFQDWNVQPSHILPWLERVHANGDIKVLGWLHQWEDENEQDSPGSQTGHVYPMRTDWNETMLRWLDTVLKGKDVGLQYGYDLEDTDLKWRHEATWPPSDSLAIEVAEGTPVALGDGAVHISGSITINVTATATVPDPIISALIYDGDEWIGEAVLRAIFRESLESPTPVPPNTPIVYRLETYPLDHVMEAGGMLRVDFGAAPRHSIAAAPQLNGVTYGTGTLHIPVAGLDLMDPQPVWMQCFAC